MFTITSIAVLILQIFGGWLSDSIGRLRSIAIGSIGGVIGTFALVLAPTWQWLVVAQVLNQVPRAVVGPSFSAFIAENSTKENRGRVYGVTTTIFQITGVIGPPLGGFIAQQWGFRVMLFWAAMLYTTAAGLRIWMATTMTSPEEHQGQELTVDSLKKNLRMMMSMILGGGVITWIFLTDGIRDIALQMSSQLQPLYFEQLFDISLQQIGLMGSIFSIAMMATPIISGKLVDKFGERVPIALGYFIAFVGFMMFLEAGSFNEFIVFQIISGLGVGLLMPAYQSLISKVVPQKMLGIFNGMFQSSLGVISLPAPYIGARLWDRFYPKLPFQITTWALLAVVFPVWFKFKISEGKAEEGGNKAAAAQDSLQANRKE